MQIEVTYGHVRYRRLPDEPTATFAVELPAGSYPVVVLVTLDDGRRYTFQGFHLLVLAPPRRDGFTRGRRPNPETA